MNGERYVPNGVILICTHGANFGFLQVTFHVDTSIYASNMATEGDRWPILNIPTFGACIATPNVPCIPSPVIWQQPCDGIYINRHQMLLENSTAKCMRGGTVSIQFTFANLQESPSGSFKRPSEYIKEGFDWVFGKLDDSLADVRAGLAEMGAPTWLQNGIDQLAWNAQACVGIVEGAINGVVGLGELIYDVVKDPAGVGGAIIDSVCDGAKSAWDWMSKGENWTNAANDAWKWASDGENWKNAANDAGQWLKDNPRAVGNVAGEALLEAGAAALTGGGSLGASAARRAGKELVEEAVEQGVKKTIKEAGKEAAERGLKKSSLPEVIMKKGGDPPGTRRNSAGRLIDEKTGRFVKEPNKKVPYDDLKNSKPCFLPGTLIMTPLGNIPIELVNVGDSVLSYNFEIERFEAKLVKKVFKNWALNFYTIKTDDGNIMNVTGNHLFWIENEKRWKPANKLVIGGELKSINQVVSIIQIYQSADCEVDTFNLEIEDLSNYLVGLNGILVHNQSNPSKFTIMERKEIKIYEVYDPGPPEKVEYVGQTDKPNVEDRFNEHKYEGKSKKNHKKDWDRYKVREVDRGNWSPYEASVREQYHIAKNGGKENLQNKRNEITKNKYDKYGHLHDPCR